MNAAIQRSAELAGGRDKPDFPHRAVGSVERGPVVLGSIEGPKSNFWFGTRNLGARKPRTPAAPGGFGVAHRAIVPFERRTEPRARLDVARDRVHFLKARQALVEESLLTGVQLGVGSACRRRAGPRTGIGL